MLQGVQPPQGMAPPHPPNYVVQNQSPQASYVVQNQSNAKQDMRPISGVKYFSIVTIVLAFILSILGIIAVVIEAQDAYVGNAIWSAVLFVLPTGLLGLRSYWKRTNLGANVSYLVLSVITCVVCAHLVIFESINAVTEFWFCSPEPGGYSYWIDENCAFAWSGRVSVDALIALFAFIQFVLSIITMSFTCYGMCRCCYNCCTTTPPAVVQYRVQNGACQLVSVGGYQAPMVYQPGYQPVAVSDPYRQGVQMVPQTFPVMAHPQMMQPHPIMLSNVPMPQVVVAPGQGSAPNQYVTSNASPLQEKESIPPSTNQDQDVPPSYGQTTSDEYHDERNLL